MKKPRILQLGIALYQPVLNCYTFNKLGYTCDYFCISDKENGWLMDHFEDFDYKHNEYYRFYELFHNLPKNAFLRRFMYIFYGVPKAFILFLYFLWKYDVWHFHSTLKFVDFVPRFLIPWQVRILKLFRKKMVLSVWGCDLRIQDLNPEHDWSPCHICPENIKQFCHNNHKYATKALCKKYGIPILSANFDQNVYDKELVPSVVAIDTEMDRVDPTQIPDHYRLQKKPGYLYVYHSFGKAAARNDMKGSTEIKQAIEELQDEGEKIEILYFDKIPNKFLKYYQAQADLVIDQLKAGWYGSTAVESMVQSKPVIVWVREDIRTIAPKDHPFIEASTENIKAVLKDVLGRQEELKEIGRKSFEFVKKHHEAEMMAGRLLQEYRIKSEIRSTKSETN